MERSSRLSNYSDADEFFRCQELLPADPRNVITDMDLFAGHCVMYTLHDGLPNVTVYPLTSPEDFSSGADDRSPCAKSPAAEEGARAPLLEYGLRGNGRPIFDTPVVCSIEPGANAAFEAETLRFTVSSPVVTTCPLKSYFLFDAFSPGQMSTFLLSDLGAVIVRGLIT